MSAIHFQAPRHYAGTTRHGAALSALTDASDWFLSTLQLWTRRARERDQLARLDDRMLSDIGISRADALMLSSKHFWQE